METIKVSSLGLLLLAFLISCSSLRPEAKLEAEISPTTVRGVLATAAPRMSTPLPLLPTATETLIAPTLVPTATEQLPLVTATIQATEAPSTGFSELRFSLTANGPAQSEFPAGTVEVYAIWEYKGMSPADRIRRIWFRDGQIWLTREEDWNWDEYGSEGTVRDISIFDNEGSGLSPAAYRLQLYANDQLQQEATFIVHGS